MDKAWKSNMLKSVWLANLKPLLTFTCIYPSFSLISLSNIELATDFNLVLFKFEMKLLFPGPWYHTIIYSSPESQG